MEVLRYWTHSSTLRGSQLNEETAGSKLFALTLYTTLWASMYRIQLSLWSHRTAEWRCRVVSLTHGTLVTYLSYYSQCVEGPSVFGIEPGLPNNNTQVFIAKLCLGYFIFDLVWCLCYQTEPPIMIVHHVLSIFGMANMIFQGKWGTELVAVIGATEVSNPLLQLRWFLKSAGYSKTILGEIVDFLFIIVFGAFRFLLSGYVMLEYVSYPNDDVLGKVGAVSMFSLSAVFYYYILGYAKKKYGRMFFPPSNKKEESGEISLNNGLNKQVNGVSSASRYRNGVGTKDNPTHSPAANNVSHIIPE